MLNRRLLNKFSKQCRLSYKTKKRKYYHRFCFQDSKFHIKVFTMLKNVKHVEKFFVDTLCNNRKVLYLNRMVSKSYTNQTNLPYLQSNATVLMTYYKSKVISSCPVRNHSMHCIFLHSSLIIILVNRVDNFFSIPVINQGN